MSVCQYGSIGSPFNKKEASERNSRCQYLDRNSVFIYLSHFLSSFGDRVWHFAVGLYLYYLYPCSLMLTAVYGLSTCGSLFILGAPVGRWVDSSNRLRAARITIVIQNTAVVISATIMASSIFYKEKMSMIWDGRLEVLTYATIIILEVVAELASMANKLVLEKDWIVVLAQGDQQKLSYLNATMRTINLSCKILAPFAVGHLLEWFSYVTGAIFIASWNVVSAFAEFYLLHIIFSLVPELSLKSKNGCSSGQQRISSVQINNADEPCCVPSQRNENSAVESPPAVEPPKKLRSQTAHCTCSRKGNACINNNNADAQNCGKEFQEVSLTAPQLSRTTSCSRNNERKQPAAKLESKDKTETRSGRLFEFWDGWKVYFSHPVRFAGLGLASLYMTVLCFDSVSIGYLSSQGVSAALSGNITAVAAFVGILGSLSFPFVRRKLGQNKAGIFGFSLETLCLLLCVMSILAPGSPFIPSSIFKTFDNTSPTCQRKNVAEKSLKDHWEHHSNVFLLVAGIVFARYGLWIADLSVTQIFQEKVHESERGVMGGVQNSLNQLLSLVKFGLTIMLPYPETFGYLICLSWIFVLIGWLLFVTYVCVDGRRIQPIEKQEDRK